MLTPKDQQRLERLHLLAKHAVEGVLAGQHRSQHKGASVEFKEHRQYVRGDEIRSIDWKLFGKTDRLFVRQYEDETNLRAMLLLDQSGSMAYRGTRATLSKHQFAVHLAACLARLLVTQQDSVGLATLDSQLQQVIPVRGTTSHLAVINSALSQSQCGMETSLATALGQAAPQLRRRGMLILISDCFDDIDQLITGLRFYRQMHNEVIVFQIWDRDELDFPFRSRTQFRSLETRGAQRLVDPRAVRETYLQRLASYRQQLSQALARERIDLVTCTTDQDLGELLSAYLSCRDTRGSHRVKGQAST